MTFPPHEKPGAAFRLRKGGEDALATLRQAAARLGFAALGLSPADPPAHLEAFAEWVASGRHAGMDWLRKSLPLRGHPARLLDGCRVVVSLAHPYSARKPCTPEGYSAARYSEPRRRDYHLRLRALAGELARRIEHGHPGSRTRVCVDSAPILERSFAFSAGLGFIGKNNLLIIPGRGSFFFLVEILTDAPLPVPAVEPLASLCGECRRCLEACPGGALEAPYRLQASRCLSYLTVEHRGRLGPSAGVQMGGCFFGCDVCQEVCPFNGPPERPQIALPSAKELLGLSRVGFRKLLGESALARGGPQRMRRNLEALLAAGRNASGA